MRALLIIGLSWVAAWAAAAAELVRNGGFEEGLLGYEGQVGASAVAEAPHAGAACLRIDGALGRNSFVQQSVAVQGGREFDVAVWVRSEDVPAGADCKAYWNVWHGNTLLESAAPLPRIGGTTPWTRQAVRVRLPQRADRLSLILQLYQSPGTVWFDELSLRPLATEEEQARREAQAAGQAAELARAVALSRSAPELAPGIRLVADAEGIFLCNERLALRFGTAAEAFGLRGLTDLAHGRCFVVPGFDSDLWRVELRPQAAYAYSTTVVLASAAAAAACSHEVEVTEAQVVLHLRWQGVPAEGEPAVDVEATVSLQAGAAARWRIGVTSRRGGAAIWLVDFPRLPALGASDDGAAETDYLAIPMQQGWRWPDPRNTVDWGEGWADYPGGGKSMQFEAYCVGGERPGGLYLATEDPTCTRKGCLVKARGEAFSYAWRHYPADMGHTALYELPYPVVTEVFSGDWWDAAQRYRRWALAQPWSASGPVRERASIPAWLKTLGVWAQGDLPGRDYAEMAAQAQRVIGFQQSVGAPLAFHAYLWQHAEAHDAGYPFLLPPKPGAREFVERLREAGVRVVPYLNIYSGDGAGPRFGPENLGALALRTAQGGLYGNPAGLLPMCPATPRWQQLMAEQFRGTLEALPVDGLYLDQLTGAPFLCFDQTHGHPAGGGSHFYQGLRQLSAAAKAAVGPERIVFGENISEGYNDVVDAQLPWAELQLDRLLPLYQAVYADYTLRFGLFIGRPDTWGDSAGYYSKLAWTFVVGQQPGWIMFGILNDFDKPEFAPQRTALRDLVGCRLATLDFLQYGQYLRPLDLRLRPVPVAWDDWSTPRAGLLAPVLNGVWRAPDGRIGIALANWSPDEQEVSVPLRAEWGLTGTIHRRACQRGGHWSAAAPVPPAGVTWSVPARAVMVLELRSE